MAAAAPAEVVELLTLTKALAEPNECPISAPLKIELEFSLSTPVSDAYWSVAYVIDSVRRRHILDLGSTTPGDLGVGSHTMKFEVAGINVAGIKPTRLTTAGLLTCTLKAKSSKGGKEPDEEVAAVNMVVQVETADGAPATKATPLESLIRSVFDPLA